MLKNMMLPEINDEMITALHSADALVFGTPTINRNAVKPVWDIISSIDLVNMKNKLALYSAHTAGAVKVFSWCIIILNCLN